MSYVPLRRGLAVGLLGILFTGCVMPERHREVLSANRALREEKSDLKRLNGQLQDEIDRLTGEVQRMTPLVMDAAALARQKKEVEAILKRFKTGGTVGELPAGVSTHETSDGVVLRVEGRVLFSSGKADLSREGQSTLTRLAPAIAEHRGKIRVAGHTDSDKIKHSSWKTNIRLSTARAAAVLEFLGAKGVPEAMMSVAGYGPHQPVDPSDKARNRRVEIVLLKDR